MNHSLNDSFIRWLLGCWTKRQIYRLILHSVYIRFIRKNIGGQTATRIHEQEA